MCAPAAGSAALEVPPDAAVGLVVVDVFSLSRQAAEAARPDGRKASRARGARRKHRCEQCGKYITTKCGLEIHLRLHSGERPFKCDVCGKKFTARCHLLAHQRRLSVCGQNVKAASPADRTESRRQQPARGAERKYYACELCGKSFSQKIGLETHLRLDCEMKPFGCDECGVKFSPKPYAADRSLLKSVFVSGRFPKTFSAPA